jgi:hypothetical protein
MFKIKLTILLEDTYSANCTGETGGVEGGLVPERAIAL